MKVIYFHQHFSTPDGATGTRSYEMARKLIQQGNQVIMICGSYSAGHTGLEQAFQNGQRRGIVDGIEVVEFELSYSNSDGFLKRTSLFLKFAYRSVKVLFSEKYDLVFATTTPLTAAIPGIVGRWLKRKPFIFEVRDLWPELPRAMGVISNPVVLWAMGVLEWAAYKSADKLVALSPGIKDGILRHGIKEESIALIPNGCDLDIFSHEQNVDQESLPWRPKGVSDSDFMAVFTGTHGKANGLESLLDVAVVLKERGLNNIKIVLVGQGKEKATLEESANQKGLDNIVFCAPVAKKKLSGLMSSANVGLQVLANVPAFYYGTSPNKFFDYLASGLPVLTNYPGWVADLVSEHRCGVAVPPENAKLFASALEQLASDPTELIKMGSAAKLLAEKRFDRNKLSTEFSSWLVTENDSNG